MDLSRLMSASQPPRKPTATEAQSLQRVEATVVPMPRIPRSHVATPFELNRMQDDIREAMEGDLRTRLEDGTVKLISKVQ